MTRVEMVPGWEEQLSRPVDSLVSRTMQHILEDARAACPVDTGALKASLTNILYNHGESRIISHMPYCAAVELGFHGEEFVRAYARKDGTSVRAHTRHGNTPAQPFLRPALYRKRDLT